MKPVMVVSDLDIWALYKCVSLSLYIHIRVYIYIHTYVYIYIYNIYIYIYVCMYVCMYVCIKKNVIAVNHHKVTTVCFNY